MQLSMMGRLQVNRTALHLRLLGHAWGYGLLACTWGAGCEGRGRIILLWRGDVIGSGQQPCLWRKQGSGPWLWCAGYWR